MRKLKWPRVKTPAKNIRSNAQLNVPNFYDPGLATPHLGQSFDKLGLHFPRGTKEV